MSAPLTDSPSRPKLRLVGGASWQGEDDFPRLDDFEGLFRRFSPYVARIGFRLLGSEADLEDLVQDVFVEAHRGLHQVKEPRAVKGWLGCIAVRLSTRRLKRRRLRFWTRWDEFDHLADPSATPEQRAEVASVYRKLERIDVDVRVAWVLRFVEGHSLEEIVEMTHASKSTVQRRIRAAQAHLKRGDGSDD